MAWLRVHQSLKDHRKTLALSDALDISEAQAIGHVVNLWLWSIDSAESGQLGSVNMRAVARAAMWDGDARMFWSALIASGFVDPDGCIHDWDEHVGSLIDSRNANKARQKRFRDAAKAEHDSGVTRTVTVTESHAENESAGVTRTNARRNGLEKSREDKSREDQSRDTAENQESSFSGVPVPETVDSLIQDQPSDDADSSDLDQGSTTVDFEGSGSRRNTSQSPSARFEGRFGGEPSRWPWDEDEYTGAVHVGDLARKHSRRNGKAS